MHHSSSRRFAGAPHGVRCPHCLGRAHRIQRRWLDRLFSVFVPVRRYWCYDCHWQGSLRAENAWPMGRDAGRWGEVLAERLDAVRKRRAAEAPRTTVWANTRRRALAIVGRGFGR